MLGHRTNLLFFPMDVRPERSRPRTCNSQGHTIASYVILTPVTQKKGRCTTSRLEGGRSAAMRRSRLRSTLLSVCAWETERTGGPFRPMSKNNTCPCVCDHCHHTRSWSGPPRFVPNEVILGLGNEQPFSPSRLTANLVIASIVLCALFFRA